MSNLTITKGYQDGQALPKSQLDTSFNDVSTWLNARDNGTDNWLNVFVSATAAVPVSITSSAATTTIKINNTATDGDPKISFQLSGSETHAFYVDDSDSDTLKLDISGGTVFRVLSGATRRFEFHDGTAISPSWSFLSSVQTGFYQVTTNEMGVTVFGTGQVKFTDGTFEPITDNDVKLGNTSGGNKRWSDVRSVLINGSDYGFANGYILREYPCSYEDVQTKSNEWMKANANIGIQVINDIGETIAIIKRDGTIQAKKFETVEGF